MSIDRERNRLYLPLDEMAEFHYSPDQWREGTENGDFCRLMQFQIERTKRLFDEGAALPSLVKGRLWIQLQICVPRREGDSSSDRANEF